MKMEHLLLNRFQKMGHHKSWMAWRELRKMKKVWRERCIRWMVCKNDLITTICMKLKLKVTWMDLLGYRS